LHELKTSGDAVLQIADIADLISLGVDATDFASVTYGNAKDVGDAAFFLGFDGMIVPSARGTFQSLVLFAERLAPGSIESVAEEPIDRQVWRTTRK
jgi:hypothetical protein